MNKKSFEKIERLRNRHVLNIATNFRESHHATGKPNVLSTVVLLDSRTTVICFSVRSKIRLLTSLLRRLYKIIHAYIEEEYAWQK